jgi:hypothetical protein
MLGMLLGYDAAGNVLATLGYMVVYADDLERTPIGLVDFTAHEEAGGEATDIVIFDSGDPITPIKGAKVWPEWLASGVHDFRVELVGPPGGKRIGALVHKASGHRRERAAIEAAIQKRIKDADGRPADIRDLVGGPDRPLVLDVDGRTKARIPSVRPQLPLVGVRP